MSKGIKFVIETHSREERETLINFIASKHLLVSVIGISDDFRYVGVSTGDVWFISVINEVTLDRIHNYTLYKSVKGFIRNHGDSTLCK